MRLSARYALLAILVFAVEIYIALEVHYAFVRPYLEHRTA